MSREGGDPFQHIKRLIAPGIADGSGGLQCEAPCEDGEPSEETLLLRTQQVIAPLERVAQSLLASGQVLRTTGEDIESLGKPFEQSLRRPPPAQSC